MSPKPLRSVLYVPGDKPRAIEEARTLEADAVILDLEDAVAPEAKEDARAAALAAIAEGGFGSREVVVRVNALDSAWGEADLLALAGAAIRPQAVLLPKVASPAALATARDILAPGPQLWAMIETPRAFLALERIVAAAAAYGLTMLVAGTNDLAKEMRCRLSVDRAPILPMLGQLVLAARAGGLSVLDGVCNTIDDDKVVEAECREALRWGFDGKTLIHPGQIKLANIVFTPEAAEIATASRIVAAFDEPANQGAGVLRVDGRMVERLHLDEATRLLAIAKMLEAETQDSRI